MRYFVGIAVVGGIGQSESGQWEEYSEVFENYAVAETEDDARSMLIENFEMTHSAEGQWEEFKVREIPAEFIARVRDER